MSQCDPHPPRDPAPCGAAVNEVYQRYVQLQEEFKEAHKAVDKLVRARVVERGHYTLHHHRPPLPPPPAPFSPTSARRSSQRT